MKTYLTYGFALALASALLTLVLFFLGYQTEAEKLKAGQWISLPLYIAITAAVLVIGVKARRAEIPPDEPFGYGRALGAGVMIALFASLFGIVVNFVYFQYLNPGFVDLMVQTEMEKMEAQGLSDSRLEAAEKGMRFMMKPPIMVVLGFFQAMLGATLTALITSIFVRRPAASEPPALD